MQNQIVKSCATLCLLLGITGHAAAQQAAFHNGLPYLPLQLAYVTGADAEKQSLTVCFTQSGQCNTLHHANFHGTASACSQTGLNDIVTSAFPPEKRTAVTEVGTITTLISKAYPDSYPVKAALFDCSSQNLPYWQGVLCLDNDATGALTACGYVADAPEEATLLPFEDIEHPEEQQVSAQPQP